jgi:hypothetical protein
VEGGLLLDVVVAEGAAVFELLPGEDEALLIGGDALLVLDLGLDVVDGVRGLDIEGDGLACGSRSRTEWEVGVGLNRVAGKEETEAPDASQPTEPSKGSHMRRINEEGGRRRDGETGCSRRRAEETIT